MDFYRISLQNIHEDIIKLTLHSNLNSLSRPIVYHLQLHWLLIIKQKVSIRVTHTNVLLKYLV